MIRTLGFLAFAVLAGWVSGAPVRAMTIPAIDAFDGKDVPVLEVMAREAADPEDRAMAAAALLSLDHRDKEAVAALNAIAGGDYSPQARALADWELCAIHLRVGDFAAADRAATDAMAIDPDPIDEETLQAVRFARALKDVAPMTREAPGSGKVAILRDRRGFLNVPVAINAKDYMAVMDTGAAYSAMSEGTAARLGLRLLPGQVRIGSATRNGVLARVAIADRLQLGTITLHNVVFIVLPDDTFTLMGGLYRLEAVIGLPVIEQLDRFAVTRSDGKEWLSYGDQAPVIDNGARIVMAGAKAYILALPNGREPPLRMVFDTGADRTWLMWQALSEHPELTAGALKEKGVLSGAGGAAEDSNALVIPSLNLDFGTSAVPLKDIKIYSRVEKIRQGVLGQDVLRTGFVVDFKTMRLSLLPQGL